MTERNIYAIGAACTNEEECVETDIEEIATFNFLVKYSQTYVFRLYQGENEEGEQEFLEVEVPVE